VNEPKVLPGRLPGAGHVLQLVRRPLEFLREAQSHGDVVRIHLGPIKAYFVNQPETLRSMLVTSQGDYDKGVHFEQAKLVIGDSLPVSDGPFHRHQRKLIHPAFQQTRLREYFEIMRDCTRSRVGAWEQDSDVHAELRSLVGLITCRALFSAGADESVSAELVRMIDVLDAGVIRRVLDPTGLVARLPLRSNRLFDAHRMRTRELVEKFIDDSRRTGPDRTDLLSTLLDARDDGTGEGMSDEQLRDEAVAMMQAGIETTAQALRWTCHVLSTHEDVQRRVHEEIDTVMEGREVTFDDLGRLALLGRVIREALRMYPPLFLISRRAITDVEVGGYRIPKGSTVLFSSYALHRDAQLYPDPDRFDPDRWLPERAGDQPPVSYMPFGAGIRSCLGERFAQIEMLTVLSTMLQRWTLDRDDSVQVKPKLSFVLSPSANATRLSPRVVRHTSTV
jgi:cytochrome P450